MADKTQANIGFEKQIWDAACVLWGHIPAAEYRKVIIGLILLRYVSTAFERRYNELVEEGDGFEDDRDAYTMENVFFVPEEARWNVVSAAAHTPEIGKVIDNAMRAIEAENKTLKGVLPMNYANPDLDKQVLGDVVDIFTNMDMGDTEHSPDNTVILSFKLTVGRIAITVGETTTNEAIAHFNTSKDNITEYLYCYLKSFDFGSLGSTSSIGTAVNSKTIKAMDFVIPGESELQEFCDIARPMFEQIKKNQFENQNLITMRDSLLPKLMSGELDVSDLDI